MSTSESTPPIDSAAPYVPAPIDPADLETMVHAMLDFISERCEMDPDSTIRNSALIQVFQSYLQEKQISLQVKYGILKETMVQIMDDLPITRSEKPFVTYHGFTVPGLPEIPVNPKAKRSKKGSAAISSDRDRKQIHFQFLRQFFQEHCTLQPEEQVSIGNLFERFNLFLTRSKQEIILPTELRSLMEELMELHPITRHAYQYTGFRMGATAASSVPISVPTI